MTRSLMGGIICLLLAMPGIAAAQQDSLGVTDTLYADVARINDQNWSITISYTNDQSVVGLLVPLKMTAGLNRIVADSAIYTGGRVEHFAYKGFRCDTAIQCVTLGMIANFGPNRNNLPPGSGRLVTVFVSSIEDKPIEQLEIDTTTTHPNNSLMMIADSVQGVPPDTVKIDRTKATIIPVFVSRRTP